MFPAFRVNREVAEKLYFASRHYFFSRKAVLRDLRLMGFHITVNKEQAVVPRGGDEASSPTNSGHMQVSTPASSANPGITLPPKALVETYWNVDLAQSGLTHH